MGQTTPEELARNAGWEPTCNLRFVEIDGRRMLQQEWQHRRGSSEWRAVPLVDLTA